MHNCFCATVGWPSKVTWSKYGLKYVLIPFLQTSQLVLATVAGNVYSVIELKWYIHTHFTTKQTTC